MVVRKVKNQYALKNQRFKNYFEKVWDEIESLDAFLVIAVPREFNSRVDYLAVSASFLLPHLDFKDQIHKVEVLFRSNVPYNEDSWQVFDDDKYIK